MCILIKQLSSDEFFNSRVRWLVAENLFWFPFISDFLLWAGNIHCKLVFFKNVYLNVYMLVIDGAPCSRKDMLSLMSKDTNVALIPGNYR